MPQNDVKAETPTDPKPPKCVEMIGPAGRVVVRADEVNQCKTEGYRMAPPVKGT